MHNDSLGYESSVCVVVNAYIRIKSFCTLSWHRLQQYWDLLLSKSLSLLVMLRSSIVMHLSDIECPGKFIELLLSIKGLHGCQPVVCAFASAETVTAWI